MKTRVLLFLVSAGVGGLITLGAHKATDSLWSFAFSLPLAALFGFCTALVLVASKDN